MFVLSAVYHCDLLTQGDIVDTRVQQRDNNITKKISRWEEDIAYIKIHTVLVVIVLIVCDICVYVDCFPVLFSNFLLTVIKKGHTLSVNHIHS